MKRVTALLLVLLLGLALMGCTTKENPPETHIVHDGVLWKVPAETTGLGDLDESRLTEGTVIPLNVMPAREGECNVNAARVQIYDEDDFFLVIIDGEQHLIDR